MTSRAAFFLLVVTLGIAPWLLLWGRMAAAKTASGASLLGFVLMGLAYAGATYGALACWDLMRKRWRLPSAGVCLAGGYVAVASALLVCAYVSGAWNTDVGIMFYEWLFGTLFPPGTLLWWLPEFTTLRVSADFLRIMTVVIGTVHAFWIGRMFEQHVLR